MARAERVQPLELWTIRVEHVVNDERVITDETVTARGAHVAVSQVCSQLVGPVLVLRVRVEGE